MLNTVFHKKLKSMLAQGVAPEILILYRNLSERKSLEIEEILIQTYGRRSEGGYLCNMVSGGSQPPSWAGKKHTIETRQKMANVPRTKEWRARIGLAHRGKTITASTRKKNRQVHLAIMQPVVAFDLATGVAQFYFECLKDAERAGFDRNSIRQVLKGVKSKYRKYGWRKG
jgi:hypothetical protein